MLPGRNQFPNGVIMGSVSDQRKAIDDLAALIEEFKLERASLQVGDIKIAFGKRRKAAVPSSSSVEDAFEDEAHEDHAPTSSAPTGIPVTSPMTGIYYGSPSPGSAAFVSPGDTVTAGQVVGLIEAMKVFNEITSPHSGIVDRIVFEAGSVVQSGDVLMYLV